MKKTTKNTSMGMLYGVCLGTSIGVVFGNLTMGMLLGMAIGVLLGSVKDHAVNNQIQENGYTIKDIKASEEKEEFIITIINRLGEENTVVIPKGQMETEIFSKGDVVYLDEDGMLEQAYDNEEE